MKDLVTKKIVNFELIDNLHYFGMIASGFLVQKKADPGVFTIPSIIGVFNIVKEFFHLGCRINLMSFYILYRIGLGSPQTDKNEAFNDRLFNQKACRNFV